MSLLLRRRMLLAQQKKSSNLLDITNLYRVTGATYEITNNNTITFYQQRAYANYCYRIKLEIGKQYTVSVENIVASSSHTSLLHCMWLSYDNKPDDFALGKVYPNKPITITATKEDLYIKCYVNYENTKATLTIVKPMVNEGAEALPYEPYEE